MLRIDDIDTPRNVAGATERIIEDLEIFGLHWDDEIYFQSDNLPAYRQIIEQLLKQDHLYPCICSRKILSSLTSPIYPGFCLTTPPNPEKAAALRLKVNAQDIVFEDRLQELTRQNLAQELGDFVIQRKDNIVAYQLAVVIDDYKQQVSHIVRGFDLLDSTPRQIFIQQLLGYRQPDYMHVPLIVDEQGYKLSKQTHAQAVDTEKPAETLYRVLQLLKQNPPPLLRKAAVVDVLNWAIAHWQPLSLKKVRAIH